MGRQTTIFDAEEVGRISIHGGRVYPGLVNVRTCRCAKCNDRLEIGRGYRFMADRGSATRSGYLCPGCVGEELNSVREWFYNRYFGSLYPVLDDHHRALDGEILSAAWQNGGKTALFAYVREAA